MDVVADHVTVAPDLHRPAGLHRFDQRRHQALAAERALHRAVAVGDPERDRRRTAEPGIKLQVFLDHQLVDAIGGDRLGGRRFRDRHRRRNAIDRAAGRHEHDLPDPGRPAQLEQLHRSDRVDLQVGDRVLVGHVRVGAAQQVEHDLGAIDGQRQRGPVGKLRRGESYRRQRVGEGRATAEPVHAGAGADQRPAQMAADEAAGPQHQARHAGQGPRGASRCASRGRHRAAAKNSAISATMRSKVKRLAERRPPAASRARNVPSFASRVTAAPARPHRPWRTAARFRRRARSRCCRPRVRRSWGCRAPAHGSASTRTARTARGTGKGRSR